MGTLIDKTSHDLALAVAANIPTCGLSLEVQQHYLANKHLIPEALLRGFVVSPPEAQSAPAPSVVTPTLFKVGETDLNSWLAKCQEFAKMRFGVEFDFGRFAIPAELPWKSVIPVFDPGGLTNRDAVRKALKDSGMVLWEEVDVMKYSGSKANKKPTLHFVQNSIRPDDNTMCQSPDELKATSKNWLDLRGYALAFGLHHFATNQYLDPETCTWFPNSRLSASQTAYGYWYPGDRKVGFNWSVSDSRSADFGARLAMPCPLLP